MAAARDTPSQLNFNEAQNINQQAFYSAFVVQNIDQPRSRLARG